tara:strand:+ start:1704 stop:2195 length:492 start_codon:yes stop_codon:yes gene_type:complete
MHIKLISKKIKFGNYKIKCAIGKRGISSKKREGDNYTPRGTFKFKGLLYRKDRVLNIKTSLFKKSIKENMGWCDDTNSKHYNKLIKFPFRYSAEKLYRSDYIYDIILIMDYNQNPVIKGKGSAIFLHISKKNYSPTLGCIAIKKKHMRLLLRMIHKNSKITIY